jgi:hypothetical protein
MATAQRAQAGAEYQSNVTFTAIEPSFFAIM